MTQRAIAYLPEEDLFVVILVNRGYVWLTELLPALIGAAPPARAAASGASLLPGVTQFDR